ncbi:MAG: tetratricopeptide repeat protein [Armatimonadota bacterium]
MKRSTRLILALVAVALLPVMVNLQARIDPLRGQFQPGRSAVITKVEGNPVVLPAQFAAGSLMGFREVVAGLLWVRCDEFFHSGNYDAIIPLIRIITWLDPHQIDVYSTGAWHLAYNFTDTGNRADARYIPSSVALLEEGIANNPTTYDLKLDLGFTIYQLKAQDFEKAAYWLNRSSLDKNAPYMVPRSLAHALEKGGKLDEAERQWDACIAQAEAVLAKKPKDMDAKTHLDISTRNRDMFVMRRIQRAEVGKHPVDTKFQAEFVRIGPRSFEVRGKINLPDGAKVDVELHDADYEPVPLEEFNWQVDPKSTILLDIGMHGIAVKNGGFRRKYDLSKDTAQYPFAKDRYVLTVSFNPRTTFAGVQDVTGWSGEGITDRNYLDTSVPGLRRIRKAFNLSKKDLL